MSRRGYGAHRDRVSDVADGRRYTRHRTEEQHRSTPHLQQPQEIRHRSSDGNITEEALYAQMCPSDGEVLPPGWEKILYHGTVVYLDHISREAHEERPWEIWRRRSEGVIPSSLGTPSGHSSAMNLRTLTSFWKRGKGRENTNRCSESSDSPQTCQLQQQQHFGQSGVAPFERTQAALRYVQQIFGSRELAPNSLVSRTNDVTTSTEIQLARMRLHSREEISTLRHEREEMSAALDLCLLAIPDDVITSRVEKSGNSVYQASGNSQGVVMSHENSEISTTRARTREGEGEVVGVVSSDGLVVKTETDAPSPQVDSVVGETNINQEQWRRLLLELVNVLLEIDVAIYADVVMRSRWPTQSPGSFGLSPLSPSKTSGFPATSPSGFTCEGGDAVLFSAPKLTPPAITANANVTPTTITAGTTEGKKGTGIDTVFRGEIKPQEFHVSEEQLALVNTITTWIILRTVLRQEIDAYSVSNFREMSTEEEGLLSTADVEQITNSSSVPWEKVVSDMMDIFCVRHRGTVEAVISLWLKYESNGRELLQSVLEKPRRAPSDSVEETMGKQAVTTASVVGGASEKRVDGQVTSSTGGVVVEHTTKAVLMDDIVEEIEMMFERDVTMSWAAYLKRQSSDPFPNRTWNECEVLFPIFFLHCHMMATYAVCSPYWEEGRVQQTFQVLKRIWGYKYETSVLGGSNGTSIPSSVVTVPETFASSNADGFSGVSTGDGVIEPSPGVLHKNPRVVLTVSERQAAAGDVESESFPSLSVNFLEEEPTRLSTLAVRTAMCLSFEEDVMPFMFQAACAAALHVRVEQCLDNFRRKSTGAYSLGEAEHCAYKECDVALASKSFLCKQGANESLIKVNIATGNYSAALDVANAHFTNAKKKWSGGKNCHWSCVSYLNSMGLLAQAQDAHRMDASLLETTQFALQQVALCEQVINDLSPVTGIYLVRYAEARRGIFQAKLFHLRMSWISYHRMNDTVRGAKYFELYMENVKHLRQSRRAFEAYTALKKRGEELEAEKQYSNAVVILKQATEYAKSIPKTPKTSSTITIGGTVNLNLPDTDGAWEIAQNTEYELELIRRKAESERNLALAYVLQAEHEVNVKERRQQLSNAVTSAYAAHNALLRCVEQSKVRSSGILIDLAASLVVTCKALLRLGQPKKATLLLEPLVADKANSASVRPPLWSDLLNFPGHSVTNATSGSSSNSSSSSSNAPEMRERLATLRVKIAAFDVYTQCLSKYDGERACRETRSACEFLERVKTWIKSFIKEDSNNKSSAGDKEHIPVPVVGIMDFYQCLNEANETIPILTITCGDSLATLGKWENALQEYSNALAMYSGGCPDSTILKSVQTEADRERVLSNYKMGESLVLSKLAEVYTALEKPKTAIHYYRQVLEYATESGDALLQYNTRIRLARLYTATGDTKNAADHWAKVSELAKEYDDHEISRETMRNIVAAQRATGMYTDLIRTAEELDTLASSEGVDAAADKRFALEALADAHLQLGQYEKCIEALEEREKVEYKCSKWSGTLYNMRARALLGKGNVVGAFKVLTSWALEARLLGNWVEVGHANTVLALAYATTRQTLKAKRHHKIALATFAGLAEMGHEFSQVVINSAVWLAHYFYLNDETVKLYDVAKDNAEPNNLSKNGTCKATTTSSAESVSGSGSNSSSGSKSNEARSSSGSSSCSSSSSSSSGSDCLEVCSDSGDLNFLLMKEEERLRERRGCKNDRSKETAHGGEFSNEDSEEDGGALVNDSMFDMNMVSSPDERKKERFGKADHSGPDGDNSPTPSTQLLHAGTVGTPGINATKAATGLTTPLPNSATPLANVSLCRHPAVIEGDEAITVASQPVEVEDHTEDFSQRETARVHTLSFRHALETMETAVQLSLMPLMMREQLIPRNPAEAVDLALLSFPHCTFVFYFAEFSTQYTVIIRPAGRFFFLKRSVQAYGLNDYHTKRVLQPSVQTMTFGRTSPSHVAATCTETGQLKGNLLLNSATRKNSTISVDFSRPTQESNPEWEAANDSLLQNLYDLHADLWFPVQKSMQMAHCSYDEAECFILVVDPTLLHLPFPAFQDSAPGSDPIGQQFTMVVTPTLAQFLYTTRRGEGISLLDAPKQDRCIFLPDNPIGDATTTVNIPPSQGVSTVGLQSCKSSTATARSSTSVTMGERRHSCSTNLATTIPGDPTGTPPCLADMQHSWTLFTGCTRKEMISAFASPCCRALMILCDPVEHMFRVADGMVRLADVTRTQPQLPESLDIIVITSDRTTATSVLEPGVAARLCLHHGCRRVLRLDLPPGSSITIAHEQLLVIFLEKLKLTLQWRMRYPYALALRMAQTEARRLGYDPVVWAAFTLLGAA